MKSNDSEKWIIIYLNLPKHAFDFSWTRSIFLFKSVYVRLF